jgi:hypothetical protein
MASAANTRKKKCRDRMQRKDDKRREGYESENLGCGTGIMDSNVGTKKMEKM